jgi:hypothetical protein
MTSCDTCVAEYVNCVDFFETILDPNLVKSNFFYELKVFEGGTSYVNTCCSFQMHTGYI